MTEHACSCPASPKFRMPVCRKLLTCAVVCHVLRSSHPLVEMIDTSEPELERVVKMMAGLLPPEPLLQLSPLRAAAVSNVDPPSDEFEEPDVVEGPEDQGGRSARRARQAPMRFSDTFPGKGKQKKQKPAVNKENDAKRGAGRGGTPGPRGRDEFGNAVKGTYRKRKFGNDSFPDAHASLGAMPAGILSLPEHPSLRIFVFFRIFEICSIKIVRCSAHAMPS